MDSPQRVKDDELVDPVDEFGLEVLPHLIHDQVLGREIIRAFETMA